MPGILTGAIQGFDAGTRANEAAAQLNLESQRIGLEKQKQDRELARQSNLDKLSVFNDQANTLAAQARPHLAYINSPPVDPTKDPEGYAKWQDSDEYKSHEKAAEDLDKKVGDIRDQRKSVQDDIIGTHARQTKEQAQQDMASVMSGATKIQDLPDGRVADLFAVKSKMDPAMFVANPKTGQPPIADVNRQLQEGFQTGKWDDKGQAIMAVVPELNTAVGHPMAGGTVTGVTVGSVHGEDGDKDNLHFTPMYQVHMPDGSVKMVQGNKDMAVPVPMSVIGQRAKNLQDLGNLAQHPDLQQKIQQSFADRTTSFHRLNDDLLAAGVPQNELLPAPYKYEGVKAGEIKYATDAAGRPVIGPDGNFVVLKGETKSTTAQQREDLLNILRDPDSTDEDKDAARAAYREAFSISKPMQYKGALVDENSVRDSGKGGSGAVKQGARLEALRAAQSQIAASYGYHKKGGEWLDKDEMPVDDDEFTKRMADVEAHVADADNLADLKVDKVIKAVGGRKGEGKPTSKPVPPKNSKGWLLHKDAKGNRAYVSPDGKQYEEVK